MFCRPPRASLLVVAALVCLAVLLAASCSREVRRPVERLALPPLENLSDDPSLDWVGWGISEVLAAQLTGSAKLTPCV